MYGQGPLLSLNGILLWSEQHSPKKNPKSLFYPSNVTFMSCSSQTNEDKPHLYVVIYLFIYLLFMLSIYQCLCCLDVLYYWRKPPFKLLILIFIDNYNTYVGVYVSHFSYWSSNVFHKHLLINIICQRKEPLVA